MDVHGSLRYWQDHIPYRQFFCVRNRMVRARGSEGGDVRGLIMSGLACGHRVLCAGLFGCGCGYDGAGEARGREAAGEERARKSASVMLSI